MSAGSVKVCGRRGLVTWCRPCRAWNTFHTRSGSGPKKKTGAWCDVCRKRLPEVR